jgi:deoxyribonucleoside regulator
MAKTSTHENDSLASERGAGRIARNRVRIAWMYYVEGLTQNEIAERLGIGRVTVVRNINEALKQREVKIWITGQDADCISLEKELKEAFGLSDAMVVPEPALAANINKAIGQAAGYYVSRELHDNMRLGVGWGSTLHSSLQTLSPGEFKGLEVVSLVGGVVEAKRFNPSEFAWQFANAVGADCYLLAAPAIVDAPETKRALIEKCGLDAVLARAEHLDIALLSAGHMAAQSTTFRFGFFGEADRQALVRAGAVGDVLFNFFDREGKLVDHPVNARVISAPISRLRAAKKRVMISGGNDKIDALLGAIKLIGCNVLISNEATARSLLARVRR